jgi:osmoprotectant transport system permease protein
MITVLGRAYRFALVFLLIYLGIMAQQVGLVDYLSIPSNYAYMNGLLWEHIYLVAVSMAFATALGVAIGIVLTRRRFRKYTGVVMYVVGLGQTIPSLAVLALMMSLLGIGSKTAIFALFVYSVLPIARNTLAGISAVPPEMIEAAKGMGMPGWRILLDVEIPNAMQVMLTGFRVPDEDRGAFGRGHTHNTFGPVCRLSVRDTHFASGVQGTPPGAIAGTGKRARADFQEFNMF